jgi:hypothetical protein
MHIQKRMTESCPTLQPTAAQMKNYDKHMHMTDSVRIIIYDTRRPTQLNRWQPASEPHYEVIGESPCSTVARIWTTIEDGEAQWIAVKSASTVRRFTREPHDILKELRLLSCRSSILWAASEMTNN